MGDMWQRVVESIGAHFAAAAAVTHTIDGAPLDSFEPIHPAPRETTFIDGGNAVLFAAPTVIVQLVRVAAITYTGTQRGATHRKEALCVVTRNADSFTITWSGADWPEVSVPTASEATIETTADLARRLAERSTASRYSSLVVFDGDLDPRDPHESRILDSLTMPHCALAKTTTLLTDQGTSMPAALLLRGPRTPWLYRIHDSYGVVKLHTLSTRAYRLDVKGIPLRSAASCLCATNDPSFPGYPYGLVEADLLARVSVREQQALTELLRTKLRGSHSEHSGALDAHAILDTIAGTKNAN